MVGRAEILHRLRVTPAPDESFAGAKDHVHRRIAISIPVADQNRALDFYTDKLGFTIITDQPFDEKQRWIELRIPKAETRVVLFTPEGDEKRIGSFMNMSYTCNDIDKTYAELTKRGVEFEGPPQEQPWGTYAMFKDSEGNRFVVSSD